MSDALTDIAKLRVELKDVVGCWHTAAGEASNLLARNAVLERALEIACEVAWTCRGLSHQIEFLKQAHADLAKEENDEREVPFYTYAVYKSRVCGMGRLALR